jgi:rubredoxin
VEEISARWMHEDVNYFGAVISHECYCSNCGYVAMRYSHMIQDIRAGRPYESPKYKYCPDCGTKMEEA